MEAAIAQFDSNQSLDVNDQLRGPKRAAVLNLLDKLPQDFLTIAMRHVDTVGGWDESGPLDACHCE